MNKHALFTTTSCEGRKNPSAPARSNRTRRHNNRPTGLGLRDFRGCHRRDKATTTAATTLLVLRILINYRARVIILGVVKRAGRAGDLMDRTAVNDRRLLCVSLCAHGGREFSHSFPNAHNSHEVDDDVVVKESKRPTVSGQDVEEEKNPSDTREPSTCKTSSRTYSGR